MLMTLLLGLLKKKLSEELAADVPIGGTLGPEKIASNVRLFGKRWTLSIVAKRTA
jgi:hypothetical protein